MAGKQGMGGQRWAWMTEKFGEQRGGHGESREMGLEDTEVGLGTEKLRSRERLQC